MLYKIYLNICRYKIALKKQILYQNLGTHNFTLKIVMVLLACKGNKMQ